MHTRVTKWGNSLALRLPKPLAEDLGLHEGSDVELILANGRLEMTPTRPKYALNDLLDGITPENRPESFDMPPAGDEAI